MLGPAQKGFHFVDYVIFASVLLVSLCIGLYHAFTGGRQKTTKEYLLGNKQLKTLPVALSILVSFVSAILVIGTPAEMYTRGTQLTMRVIGYCLACVLSSILFVPLFYGLNVTSSFEYLEKRFNSKLVKLMGSIMMLVGNIFYMGLVMYTPSSALEAATGFPLWGSIVATGAVSTIYTTMGGMKAVIWTDVFQAFVMIGGMLAIVVIGSIKVGGLSEVWNISNEGGRLIFFDFDVDPTQRLNFWSVTIGGMFSTLTIFGVGQSSVQRYCALPTLSQARMSVFLNIPGLILINIMASMVGLVVYAFYTSVGCDPLKQGYIDSSNQLVPYFVIDVLGYPGFPGVFLAVLFSAALSSMSSALNAAAAVTWEDIFKYFFGQLTEEKKALFTKFLVVFYGGLAMFVAFITQNVGMHVLQASLSFTGATMGPSLGMFILGAFFPWANAKGAVSGCLVSIIFSLWLAVGTFLHKPHRDSQLATSTHNCLNTTNATTWDATHFNSTQIDSVLTTVVPTIEDERTWLDQFYSISFLWYSAIGVVITLFFGLIVSLFTRDKSVEVDSSLLIPLRERICCCLPTRHRDNHATSQLHTDKQDSDKNARNGMGDTLLHREKQDDTYQTGDQEMSHPIMSTTTGLPIEDERTKFLDNNTPTTIL